MRSDLPDGRGTSPLAHREILVRSKAWLAQSVSRLTARPSASDASSPANGPPARRYRNVTDPIGQDEFARRGLPPVPLLVVRDALPVLAKRGGRAGRSFLSPAPCALDMRRAHHPASALVAAQKPPPRKSPAAGRVSHPLHANDKAQQEEKARGDVGYLRSQADQAKRDRNGEAGRGGVRGAAARRPRRKTSICPTLPKRGQLREQWGCLRVADRDRRASAS